MLITWVNLNIQKIIDRWIKIDYTKINVNILIRSLLMKLVVLNQG